MKHKYLIILLLISFPFVKVFSQNCISLGCAANYGSQTIDATVPDAFGDPGTCYDGIPYKQVFWQFFYSPFGGDFTQTYTPTSTGDPVDLDYIVFDMGTSGPASITCPVDVSAFTEVLCGIANTTNIPTGPGVDGTITTIAGRFYAVAVYFYQIGSDPSYTFDIGNPQINGADLDASNCPGVLPVKLSSFEAKVNSCVVNLEWIAQTESNFKHYQVEYCTDGRNFRTIATILAHGTGNTKKYSYSHNDPSQGMAFYRLKMTDVDGSIEFSKTIVISLDCDRSSVFVYPNPVTDVLNVNITNLQNEISIASLYDNTGKLVYTGSMKSGTNKIDMTKFAKGIYLLRLKNNTATQSLKIIK